MPASRCAELGISEDGAGVRDGRCRLGFARLSFSAAEICKELGVTSLGVRDGSGRTILDCIEAEARVSRRHDTQRSEPRYAFVYPVELVSCKAELLGLIESAAMGVTAVNEMRIYPRFEADMCALGESGDAIYVFNSETGRGAGFRRGAKHGARVDADLQALWDESAKHVCGRGRREIEQELYSLGLQATREVKNAGGAQPQTQLQKKRTRNTGRGTKRETKRETKRGMKRETKRKMKRG